MNKWTLIGLICADGDSVQSNQCLKMFREMFSLRLPDDVSILVWLTIEKGSLQKLDAKYQPAGASDFVTRLYAIRNRPVATRTLKCGLVLLEEVSGDERVVLKPAALKKLFERAASDPEYAGSRNLLVTWGHGNPYGMFNTSDMPDSARKKMSMLDTPTLAGVIRSTFGARRKKIDTLISLNCNIDFFDSIDGLARAGVASLVAAPNGMNFIGYNYTKILSRLFANPSLQPKALAKLAISTIDEPGGDLQTRLSQLHLAAIYANDLTVAREMGQLINALGKALLAELPAKVDTISTALSTVPPLIGFYSNVDFFEFVEALATAFGKGWQKELIGRIRKKGKQLQIGSYIGKGIRKKGSFPLGFTVCLPGRHQKSYYYELYFQPKSKFRSPFAGGSWSRFVYKFVNLP